MAALVSMLSIIIVSQLASSQNPPNTNIGPIQYLGPPLRFPPDPNPNPNSNPNTPAQTPRLISLTPCPNGENIVNCFIDPCRFATCPGIQGATCESNYCGGCNAIWKDPFTLKQLTQSECHPSTPFPIDPYPIDPFPIDTFPVPPMLPPSVQPQRPCLMVYCFARPCSVNTCPAYPEATCIDDYCGGCKAIFTDINTGKQLTDNECKGEPSPPVILTPSPTEPGSGSGSGPIPVCTADVKECPDGSFMGRDPYNNCEFKTCPISINQSPPLPANQECPPDTPTWPKSGSSCSFTGLCSYGQETCCGATHPSYKCHCEYGEILCFYTDACFAASVMGCDITPEPIPLPKPEPIPYPKPVPLPLPIPCTADAKKCPDGSYVTRDYNNGCEWEPCPFPILPAQPDGCQFIKCATGQHCCDNGQGQATCCPDNTLFPMPIPRINPCTFTTILCPIDTQCCDNGNGIAICCPVDPIDPVILPRPWSIQPIDPLPTPSLPTLPPACAVITCIYGTYCCPDGNGGVKCCTMNNPTDPIPHSPVFTPKPIPEPPSTLPLPPGCMVIFCPRNTHCCDNGNGQASCCPNTEILPDPVPLPPVTPIDPPPIAILCTADVKSCPDGSYVHRDSTNNCEFPQCPTIPIPPRPTILPKPIYCTMDVRRCPDGTFVSRDSSNNCEFQPCLRGIGSAPQAQIQIQPQTQPQTQISAASAITPGSILNMCGKLGDKCSIGISLNDRCCNSGHHGIMKCSLDQIDSNGNEFGKCCIKPKKSGCKINEDCCYEDGICGDNGICKRDINILKVEAAQKVENNFDNFEVIKDTKGTRYMAISEATVIVIMIIILFLFPILYYVYYKKYIVSKIQQQARREVFHGLEVNHNEKSEFNDTSSDEANPINQQYVD